MRKVLIALAAVAALVVLMPLEASARYGVGGGGGRGGGGGGWHGGGGGGGMRGLSAGRSFGRAGFGHGMRGLRASGFRHLGLARFRGGNFRHAHLRGWHSGRLAHRARFIAATPLLYAPFAYDFADWGYDYAYYDGCYEPQPLLTSRGLVWQRTWVCY